MKGARTLHDIPFRYGGIMHDYEKDVETWASQIPNMKRCWCCGGYMRNHVFSDGSVLKRFPYVGFFKISRGKNKGRYRLRVLCRACAYLFERGVIEMDGNTYRRPDEFNERKYKEEIGNGQIH